MLDLKHLTSSVSEAEHVGIQSSIDLHERKVYEETQLQHRGSSGERDIVDEKCASEDTVYDPTCLLVIEDAPLRYDVDIVTKLIVYAGESFFLHHFVCGFYSFRHYQALAFSQSIQYPCFTSSVAWAPNCEFFLPLQLVYAPFDKA